ncbi:MAG TPA: toll/interleukin-1 receptor domain-containing protein [Phototrophicaceae bacterium]|nr:toll/interleukin-1 receptor domain-containing protein [Phototrophicaceae bacterium]
MIPIKPKVFISHRNSGFSNLVTNNLHQELKINQGYEVFWDYQSLRVGISWSDTIYKAICASDVLIVLLEKGVLDSVWVQREVDIARGAHIQILPIRIDSENIDDVAEKLNIRPLQYHTFNSNQPNYLAICSDIERLAQATQQEQNDFVKDLNRKWDPKRAQALPADNEAKHKTYTVQGEDHPINIHLATGDMLSSRFKGIEVIVNSENNYLQMARIYETQRVSSRLRYGGSLVDPNTGRLLEDTIQAELEAYASYVSKSRPIKLSRVIPTTAGHRDSVLRKENEARYVFHAITVSVMNDYSVNTMKPIETDKGIYDCVQNCLKRVLEVNDSQGVISPRELVLFDGTAMHSPHEEQEAAKQNYQPIRSIIFPLLAAGHANRPTGEVIGPMVKGIRDFIEDHRHTSLTDIYVCVYYAYDIETVENEMDKVFRNMQ